MITGKIRPSKSPMCSGLLCNERDKPTQISLLYLALNWITKRESSPFPRSGDMFYMQKEVNLFSKMYLKTLFHWISVRAYDIKKWAFNAMYRQFEFLSMPIVLCNALPTLLRNRLVYACINVFLVVCMEDLLTFSKDDAFHIEHLRTVSPHLKNCKLYVSPKKCELKMERDKFPSKFVERY